MASTGFQTTAVVMLRHLTQEERSKSLCFTLLNAIGHLVLAGPTVPNSRTNHARSTKSFTQLKILEKNGTTSTTMFSTSSGDSQLMPKGKELSFQTNASSSQEILMHQDTNQKAKKQLGAPKLMFTCQTTCSRLQQL